MENPSSTILPLLSINYRSCHPPTAQHEPVKNTHDRERKTIRYQFNLSLQDGNNSHTLPTWNTLQIKLFQTHHKRCLPAVHAQVLKCIRKALRECYFSKKGKSNFKLLATLPNNAKAGKRVSVTVSSYQIQPGAETREAEHLTNVNGPTV